MEMWSLVLRALPLGRAGELVSRVGLRACEPGEAGVHRRPCWLMAEGCGLKAVWINFVVAGSPAHPHRRFAPLLPSLKGGRD
jgi:hypothetical protein